MNYDENEIKEKLDGNLSKSDKYENYLTEHRRAVMFGMNYIYVNIITPTLSYSDMFTDVPMDTVLNASIAHDSSKYDSIEFEPYVEYFYGDNKASEEVKTNFEYAWLHHIHTNPHHWQYWVLINDEDGIKALEMPNIDIIEMVADWWSFSINKGEYDEIFEWYDKHKEKMILAPKTKEKVEFILDKLKEAMPNIVATFGEGLYN